MPPLRKIGLLLLVFVAVPVGVVAFAELAALGENERVLREIYDRHVETVLSGINQHVWTVANEWADDLGRRLADGADADAALAEFVAAHPSVEAAFVADTAAALQALAASPEAVRRAARGGVPSVERALALRPTHARRLLADRTAGYRRLLPIPLYAEHPNATVALAFVTGSGNDLRVAGFVLDAWTCIESELTPKLREVAKEHFVVGIAVDDEVRYAEAPATAGVPLSDGFGGPPTTAAAHLLGGPDVQERALWVFPNATLRIRPAGTTIGSIVADRTQRSLLLVGLLALALAVGAAFLFRTIRRQVELGQAKAVFVQNVSHELRTPLALIRMYAETLELGRVPEARQRDYVRTIAQEAGRLTRLVNNILNFSRIESGRKEVAAAPFDLNALAADALALYRFHLDSEGFAVDSALAEPPPVALGDREATSEALLNLIDNAVKYSEAERHLTVATGTDDGAVWVEVQDRGPGIALREQKRIFDEFYRVPTGAVHNAKGTGLGLALVKHLAEAQGGRVTVRSAPGHGSTFRLALPAAPVPHAVPALPTA
ncbi:MAG: HAMP domain-containing sensor histidine kinase [Rhodothermales bacterium]